MAVNPLLLLDWGASGPFYKSDLTRVLWTRKPGTNGVTPEFRDIYEVVLRAQAAAIAPALPQRTAAGAAEPTREDLMPHHLRK